MASSFQDALKSVPLEPAEPIVSRSGQSRVNRRGNITSHFINFCIFLWLQEGFCKPIEHCLSLDWKQRNDAQDKEAALSLHLSFRRGLLCLSLTDPKMEKNYFGIPEVQNTNWHMRKFHNNSRFYTPKIGRTVRTIKGEQKLSSPTCLAIPLSPHRSKHSSTWRTTYGPPFKTS